MSFETDTSKRTEVTPSQPYTAMEATLGIKPSKPEPAPKVPSRPDVLASNKWHDTAMEAYPESAFFHSAKADHMSITNALDQLDYLKNTRDPRVTPAAHAEKLTQQAEQVAKRLEDRIKSVAMRNASEIQNVTRSLDDQLGISEDSSHGMEIRAKLASMSDDDRRNAIAKAMADKDSDVMAAVLNGPSFLTGLSADEKARFKDSYARRHAPERVAELEAIRRSAQKLEDAAFGAPDFIRKNYVNRDANPDIERANEAQRRWEDVLKNL